MTPKPYLTREWLNFTPKTIKKYNIRKKKAINYFESSMKLNKDEITEIYLLKCQHILQKQEPQNATNPNESKKAAPSVDDDKVKTKNNF